MQPSRFFLVVAVLACVGCGGSQPGSKTNHGARSSGAGASGQSEPQLPSCDDGTCFSCGDGVCPTGFYCEINKGVAGCAWLPSCAKTPGCDCLRSTIQKDSRCKCEDRKGVGFVTCSG